MINTDAGKYGSEYDKISDFIKKNDQNQSWSLIGNKIARGNRILEFGPAAGYMTKYFKEELNCDVYIAEIDAIAAQKASKYAKDYYIGDIETYDWVTKWKEITFDAIIFADVLEHLKDPWTLLSKATQLLEPTGRILASIPNICHNSIICELWNNRFAYTDVGLLDNTHLRFFSEKSAIQLFLSAGLEIESIEYTHVKTKKRLRKSLPWTLRRSLKKRPNADVFQFIISGTKKRFNQIHKSCS